MALIKNLFWVIVAAVLGYSIYLFLPVITTRTEISQEARGKVEYISRGMRGKKLNVAVAASGGAREAVGRSDCPRWTWPSG